MTQFRVPVRSAVIWGLTDEGEPRDPEDIAADLDEYDTALENYVSNGNSPNTAPVFNQSFERGKVSATFAGVGSYTSIGTFSHTFSGTPVVNLTVECGRGQNITPILTAVSGGSFTFRLANASTASTTTLFVHWTAVEQ
jgi:hypothetical protein